MGAGNERDARGRGFFWFGSGLGAARLRVFCFVFWVSVAMGCVPVAICIARLGNLLLPIGRLRLNPSLRESRPPSRADARGCYAATRFMFSTIASRTPGRLNHNTSRSNVGTRGHIRLARRREWAPWPAATIRRHRRMHGCSVLHPSKGLTFQGFW